MTNQNSITKYLFSTILLSFFTTFIFGQINSNGASMALLTNYPPDYLQYGQQNDSIFIFCGEVENQAIGSLIVSNPEEGTVRWFKSGNSTFIELSETSDTISDLTSGYYKATVDNGVEISEYTAWVWVNFAGNDDFLHITFPGESESFTVDENSYIKVCFWAEHSYVSDLGFYLKAPGHSASNPGDPGVVQLCPAASDWGTGASQGSWTGIPWSALGCSDAVDENTVCNSGNNVEQFCFKTHLEPGGEVLASGNPDYTACVCDLATPLTGDFASVGSWEYIYSYSAESSDWSVQIFDCEGADYGSFKRANMTIVTTDGTEIHTFEYDTGELTVPINDGSCGGQTATLINLPLVSGSVHYELNNIVELPEICYVNISQDYKNTIHWQKPEADNIFFFEIFKKVADTWELIGTVNYEDSPEFTDSETNPDNGWTIYSVRSVGPCYVFSERSPEHHNSFISLFTDGNNNQTINISPYSGIDVNEYIIYRGDSPENMDSITTIGSDQLSYTELFNPEANPLYYRVGFVYSNNCNDSLVNEIIYSNLVSFNNTVLIENKNVDDELTLFPNPTNGLLNIKTIEPIKEIYLYTTSGIPLFNKSWQNNGIIDLTTDFQLNMKGLKPGTYYIVIKCVSKEFNKKIILE